MVFDSAGPVTQPVPCIGSAIDATRSKGRSGIKKIIVAGDESEPDALARAGGIPDGVVIIITGVTRARAG
jgi:hypothetical protein